MLQKQNISLIFGQGLNQAVDEKVVPAGKLLVLENARMDKQGALNKRYGHRELSKLIIGGGSVTTLKNVSPFFDELVMFDSNRAYSYSEGSKAWADRGFFSSVGLSVTSIIRNTASQSTPDVSYVDGVSVHAWEDSRGGVRCTVVDEITGLSILTDQLVEANSIRPRCSSVSGYLFIHYVNSSTNQLKVRRISALAPALEAAAIVAGNINTTTPNFDITPYGNNLVLSYQTTGAVVNTSVLSAAGLIGTAIEGFPTPVNSAISGSGAIAVAARYQGDANDGIYLFMHNTTDGVRLEIYTVGLGLAYSATIDTVTTVVNQITALVTDGACRVWYEVSAASASNSRIKSDSVTRLGVVASGGAGTEYLRSCGISGKAFKDQDGVTYFVANHASTLQPTYYTVRDISTSRGMVANILLPSTASGVTIRRSTVSNVARVSESEHIFPALVKARLVSEAGTVYGQIGVSSIKLLTDEKYQTKTLGQNMHISGGVMAVYDGLSCVEAGFLLFPEGVSNSAGGGGAIEAGTRLYAVVYEWSDANGQIHQSAPSIGLSVINTLNQENTLTIPTLRITEKKTQADRSSVSIVLYRTRAAGSIYYRVSSITSPTLNSTTADTVTIVDGLADTAIGSNQLMYTTGGVLENIVPFSCSAMEEYRNRIVANVLEDYTLTQYSRAWVKDESVQFSDALAFRSSQDGGAILGYKAMDEKLIIFKQSQIAVQVGNGPTDAGAQDDFIVPQGIASDVGSLVPLSMVAYPGGIVFKSDKGYYNLSRSLETSYIGNDVQDFNNLDCVGAILVAENNEIRFYHSDGPTLVYDYKIGQWGTDTGLECSSACLWRGVAVVGKSDGRVLVEDKTTFRDGGSSISMRIGTSWLSIAGLQGAQRIYRALFLGSLKSNHVLRIQVCYDFQDAVAEQFLFDSEQILGASYFGSDSYWGGADYNGGSDGLYQMEVLPELQKCQSVKFQIDDLNPGNIEGAGFSMVGMLAVVGVKAGPARLAYVKRISST